MRLDRAVLVGLPGVVPARPQAVVPAQVGVALGQIGLLLPAQVLVGGRQAVGAEFAGHLAQGPERVLEVLGEGSETLPAQDHADELPTTERQDEVIEQVFQRLAGDGDAELPGVGEVRQGLAPRLLVLAKDHVAPRPAQRAPIPNPALERPADLVVRKALRVSPLQVMQQRDRPEAGIALQHRH